jgi:hypothetical protein
VASNTTLGPCSQGPSRHVLPHAAPGFFAGCGRRDWWSSLTFASILLPPRDDILAPCSGGRTQDQGMTILSSDVAMVFLLSSGSRDPGHLFKAVELCICHRSPYRWRGNLICNTISTWSTRLLSATGSTDTSIMGLLTSFQSSSSSGSNISAWDKFCTYTVHPWVAMRHQALTTGVPMWRFPLPCLIRWYEHLFPQAEGRRFSTCSLRINPTFQIALLLGGYSTSVSL